MIDISHDHSQAAFLPAALDRLRGCRRGIDSRDRDRARRIRRRGRRRRRRAAHAGVDDGGEHALGRERRLRARRAVGRHFPAARARSGIRRGPPGLDDFGGPGTRADLDRAPGRRSLGRRHRHGAARVGRGPAHRRPAGQRHQPGNDWRARQDGRRAGGGGRAGRLAAAHQPDDGRHLRARADRQQGQRLRRRRALFERRAARRRQHVPRPHRSGSDREHRGPPRPVERAVRQRRARRQRPVPHAAAGARSARRRAMARMALGGAGAPRTQAAAAAGLLGYTGAKLRADRDVRRPQGRRASGRAAESIRTRR